jgi:hypothetical protein
MNYLWYVNIIKCQFYIWFNKEEFEDTKGAIRIRKSKKDRQHNGQKKKDKQRSTKLYIEN